MIEKDKALVIDIDGTLCPTKKPHESYVDLMPDTEVVKLLVEYKNIGFRIILYTARNMRTYEGNLGLINANTAKFTMFWLDKHNIPYDEIHLGKPWPGENGFYIDDKTIRPSEFKAMRYEEIMELLENEQSPTTS